MSPRLARRRAARGQTLVLAVLMMLVVTMMTFFTFTVGVRTRRKLQLQAVADSSAYSLAVAEARAFNFYAFSNRALVAQEISILSVHAHQSYFAFYEDVLAATGRNYKLIAEQLARRCSAGSRESCDAKDRALRISRIYLDSSFDPTQEMPQLCDSDDDCHVDVECAGEGTCDLESARKRGARWFHKQWHGKTNSNSCYRLLEGSIDHFRKMELLRAHQLRVEAQLKVLMTGKARDGEWVGTELNALPGSTTSYGDPHVSRTEIQGLSLAQGLARIADPALTAQESAGRVSLGYYRRAVDNGLLYNYHKDYDEILAGTRYPGFLTRRGPFREDVNWKRLQRAALKAARGKGTPNSDVVNEGTARALKIGDGQADPGANNANNPLKDVWPPVYPGDASPGASARPYGGRVLSQAAHRSGHDQAGFGESDGLAAEDHGSVTSVFQLPSGARVRAVANILPGRNGVWADPHDFDADPDDPTTAHSHHIFHGDLMSVAGHGKSLGKCTGPGCDTGVRRGVYRGHMRFKIGNLRAPGDLWNMPRTLTLITRAARETHVDGSNKPWPWEFQFKAGLPGPVAFDTVEAPGDVDSGKTMAALAAGLVYFHKPPNSGEEYGEPPNLWNPFWRAKLHPVKQEDAMEATETGHYRTYLLLKELSRWSAVNY